MQCLLNAITQAMFTGSMLAHKVRRRQILVIELA
jgi:hypothetical protein